MFDRSHIYSHIVFPPPARVVFFAGQWGGDVEGSFVEGGSSAQVARSFENVQRHLDATGIGPG